MKIRSKLPASKPDEAEKYGVEERWGKNLARSFTPVSDFFLDNYHRLNPPIRHTEAIFIIHLFRHKWGKLPPYPSWERVAKYMGITATAVRNIARSLVKKGYLKKVQRQTGAKTNNFYLKRLLNALSALQTADAAAQKRIETDDEDDD